MNTAPVSSSPGESLTFGFLGDAHGALAQELRSVAELVPLTTGEDASTDAVVLDSTASAGDLSGLLDSGKTVVFTQMSAAQTEALRALLGASPAGSFDGLAVTRRQAAPGYHCCLIPSGKPTAAAISNEFGASAASVPASPGTVPSFADRIAVAIQASREGAEASLTTAGVGQGLIPPPGATFGQTGFSATPTNWGVQNTGDKTAGNSTQNATTTANFAFYVYYVDGENVAPYYIVIFKQTGTFSPGNMIANNNNSKGFFQITGEVKSAVTQTSGAAFPGGVSIVWHSPSASGSNSSVPVYIQEFSMILEADDGQGGTTPTAFTPQEQAGIYLQDWGCQDNINGINPDWLFHQVTLFDPTVNTFNTFSDWWSSVYNSNNVDAPPALSTSALTYETLNVWTFDASLINTSGPNGRGLAVEFSGSWSQGLAFLDNPSGSTNGHHVLTDAGLGWGWAWYVDLGAVAVKTP